MSLSRIRRAEIYLNTEQFPRAVEELTRVIERLESSEYETGFMVEQDALRTAFGLRSETYYALGEDDKGAEDLRRQQSVGMIPMPDTGDMFEFNDQGPAPPAPEPPGDNTPPAPAVDPSAWRPLPQTMLPC